MSSIENISNSPRLNSLQISLLRLFSQNISDDQTLEIRKLMMNYFDVQLKAELETVIEEKGYTEDDFRQMLNSKS
ncbi:hypothetical protein VB796_01920 [Arcicella sp. LKC2W]|jgi:hypothetical protein|uniref:hypothetical protein n=1 Tax=Arcicella sp. LKC2W TaxID=2984198 RepID=UPI002B21B116|nr:hypothetical protein [Arcicella sp. LKC2W]MEA5457775.1 hypothetical protein [Arcicella sp. LKC2W]